MNVIKNKKKKKKKRIHVGIVSSQGSPEETRRFMKPGLPSHKEVSEIK